MAFRKWVGGEYQNIAFGNFLATGSSHQRATKKIIEPGRLIQVSPSLRVTGGELFEDIVAREYYSEADAR